MCGADERRLAADGVNAVGEEVGGERGEEGFALAGVEEVGGDSDVQFRVDVAQAFGHHGGFRAAEGAVQGEELAVKVGGGDGVVIKQDEVADAGAGDGFGAVAANAAEAGDEDGFVAQAVDAVCADEDLAAGVGCGHFCYQLKKVLALASLCALMAASVSPRRRARLAATSAV